MSTLASQTVHVLRKTVFLISMPLLHPQLGLSGGLLHSRRSGGANPGGRSDQQPAARSRLWPLRGVQ
jgi:hypothetical protein